MNVFRNHGLAILAAVLMVGGVLFWGLIGILAYQAYSIGRPVSLIISMAASTSTPTIPPAAQATYVAIPTVGGPPQSTPEPQITPTVAPTATALPPTATAVPEPTAAEPTALPPQAPTPEPPAATAPSVASVPACPTRKNEVLMIEGTSNLPAASALALLYDGKYVGGGSVKPGGVFSIPLLKAPRIAGEHTIDVVVRGTETHARPVFVKRTTCTIVL